MVATTVFTPTVSATLNGSLITGVTKARVVSSFNDPVSKIYVSVYPAITWAEGDTLAVTMGSGTNNVLSGTGTIYQADYLNAGPTQELVARGPLFKAQKYRNNQTNGLTLNDLTLGPATDEAIAQAVLTVAGVSYNPADIGGTGIRRGTLAPSAYTWRQGETALEYLNRLTKASLGYRMVETIGGDVKRIQVFGRPSTVSDFNLSQGVDIFSGGHTQYDAFGRYTAVTVSGYDYGTGSGSLSWSYPDSTPAGIDPYLYSSEMIERTRDSDAGEGISAAQVGSEFILPQVDRVVTRVSGVKTPRDDVFEPGQTHLIDADWLGLDAQKLLCMSVTRECDAHWFVQTLEYIGGGIAVGDFVLPTGRAFWFYPPPAPRRMRDYTFVDPLKLNLLGQDIMVPSKQWFDYQRGNVLSRLRLPDYTFVAPLKLNLLGQDIMLNGTIISVNLPPRGPLRARDYTGNDRFELVLIGRDAMIAGDQQMANPPRRNVFPEKPWEARAHGGLLNDGTNNATNTVFIP